MIFDLILRTVCKNKLCIAGYKNNTRIWKIDVNPETVKGSVVTWLYDEPSPEEIELLMNDYKLNNPTNVIFVDM